MRGKSLVSKYLILSIIILTVGVPTAYAITITLGGDPVIINGILDLMGNRITNVGTPTASTDAATKAYVDSASGTDTLALLGCTNNQVAQFVGSVWVCVDKVSDADALDGIDSTGFSQGAHTVDTDTVGGLSCSANQVARWDGSNWVCSTVSTISLHRATLDSTDDVGQYTSIAIGFDNFPVISYFDSTNLDLKLVHCTNTSCSTNDTPVTLDSTDSVGEYTSIAIGSDNFPVISYYDATNLDLKLVHCTNTSCSTFDTPVTLDSSLGCCDLHSSITIGTDGFPVISYRDNTTDDLKVAHCTNTSCSTFDTPVTLDSTDDVGQYTSIAIGFDNLPVISYRDFTNFDLKLVHCTNISCSTKDTPVTLDFTGNVGTFTSIAIGSDNFPVVSYFDFTNLDLKLVHCTNISCSTNDTPVTLDFTGNVGQHTSIAIGPDGFSVISYLDGTNFDLKSAACTVQGECIGSVIIFE